MNRFFWIVGLTLALPYAAMGADRLNELERLVGEYKAEETKYFNVSLPEDATAADSIRRYEEFPAWRFIPRFLELAESQPDDETAFRCCQWIVDRTYNVANSDKLIFDADQKAWEILAAHHSHREDLPMLCLRAISYHGPARERFLRLLVKQEGLSRE